MINPSKFSRICYFDYVDKDMLRGTVYYKRRDNKDLPQFLADRSLYRVAKIMKRESIMLDSLSKNSTECIDTFNQFINWANQPFNNEDRLYKYVQYFENQYSICEGRRYLLSAKNAGDLFINTVIKKQVSSINDLEKVSNKDLKAAFGVEKGKE